MRYQTKSRTVQAEGLSPAALSSDCLALDRLALDAGFPIKWAYEEKLVDDGKEWEFTEWHHVKHLTKSGDRSGRVEECPFVTDEEWITIKGNWTDYRVACKAERFEERQLAKQIFWGTFGFYISL